MTKDLIQGERDNAESAKPGLGLRKAAFAVLALGFVPLYAVVRSRLPITPPRGCLIGAAVFLAVAVTAFWLLGREPRRSLRVWRAVFVAWAMLLLPTLLTIADGLVTDGWPAGKFNRPIARLLVLLLVMTVPAFLTSFGALVRAYRATAGLAIATGLAYFVDEVYLLRATAPAKGLRVQFENVLDIVLFSAQIASYAAIPVGVLLVVGGILTFRAARRPG